MNSYAPSKLRFFITHSNLIADDFVRYLHYRKVRNLGEILAKLAKQIEEELGWVVLFMAGGVDEMGNVSDLM